MSESITLQAEVPFGEPEEPERWLPVPDYEGFYEVSDLGRVRRAVQKKTRGHALKGGHILKPIKTGKYPGLTLSMNGELRRHYVHRLVLAAFVGPCPEGMEVLHGDDDKTNNRLSNLRYDTHKRNQEEAAERGRSAFGERNGGAILTEELVAEIRSAAAAGVQGIAMAEYHGVSRATISRVVRQRLWTQTPDLLTSA